ncbi:uncharacterized protein LOC131481406 [Ochotona princeps]|uniref:uncharacterized protein LOC131481406 n=1 Tax=Ochotona princeps TaxID=9978 RepID=UPI002714BF02|nr:uncharacterized protein LOC131481406 [Ochotona princeps]
MFAPPRASGRAPRPERGGRGGEGRGARAAGAEGEEQRRTASELPFSPHDCHTRRAPGFGGRAGESRPRGTTQPPTPSYPPNRKKQTKAEELQTGRQESGREGKVRAGGLTLRGAVQSACRAERKARIRAAWEPRERSCVRARRPRGAGGGPRGTGSGSGTGGTRTDAREAGAARLGSALRSGSAPAPRGSAPGSPLAPGTNSGQSHDAGAARSLRASRGWRGK